MTQDTDQRTLSDEMAQQLAAKLVSGECHWLTFLAQLEAYIIQYNEGKDDAKGA